MAGSIRSFSSRHSSRGESHGSYAENMLREAQAKDKTLDLRIKMVKKAAAAAKVLAREFQALGLDKDEAGRLALHMFEMSLADDHGGH